MVAQACLQVMRWDWRLLTTTPGVWAVCGGACDHSWGPGGRRWWAVTSPGVQVGGIRGLRPLLGSRREVLGAHIHSWFWAGCGSGQRPLLGSRREAVVTCDHPWSPCRQCPYLHKHTHREEGYDLVPTPPLMHTPNNGDWPSKVAQASSKYTPSHSCTGFQSPSFFLHTTNAVLLLGFALRSPSSSPQPPPALGM